MAESDQKLPPLVQALAEVGRWRAAQEQAAQVRLGEVSAEQERLESDIAELQRQVAELGQLREAVRAELAALPTQEVDRTREAVEAGLDAEAEALVDLEAAYADALKAREDRVAALLAEPEMSRLVEEYEQFQGVQPTLANLPAGYRDAILAHHDSVQRRLAPVLEALRAPLAVRSGEPVAVTVVASLNPGKDGPEALALILPVTFEVYEDWADRSEDLCAVLAYRVVGALGGALRAVGVPDAAVQYADYRGLLAIQVWFGAEAPQGDVREAVNRAVERVVEESTELRAVGVELYTAWLDPRVITGDADEAEPDEPTATDSDLAQQVSPPLDLEA